MFRQCNGGAPGQETGLCPQCQQSLTLVLGDPRPYPSLCDITVRIDANDLRDLWYDHLGDNLHFRDFGFQVRIQVAHRLSQRADCGVG
jgi:hypothetical protein